MAAKAVLSASTEAVTPCIPASTFNSESSIFAVVTALSAILAVITESVVSLS